METVRSYDDPLRATSPPRFTKVAARPEPEGGYLMPGLKVDVAEKPTRDAKSELLLYNIWLAGKQCEMQGFK